MKTQNTRECYNKNMPFMKSYAYKAIYASEILKTRLPSPNGTITRQKGYRANPIDITIKSLEKGTREP